MRSQYALGLLLSGIVGCDGATPPDRPAPYAYAIQLRDGTLLSFRWPESSLPVRIWVQPGTDLRFAVEAAIREWEAAALYHEFTGVIVDDPGRADVHVRLGDSYSADPSYSLNCGGSTTIGVERDTTITLPFVTTLRPRSGVGSNDVGDCLILVATHELGHALGLFLESDDPDDLMHIRPSPDGFSARDLATFTTLYHSPVSVRLPAGR